MEMQELSDREAALVQEFRLAELANGEGCTAVLFRATESEFATAALEEMSDQLGAAFEAEFDGTVWAICVKRAEDRSMRANQRLWLLRMVEEAFAPDPERHAMPQLDPSLIVQ